MAQSAAARADTFPRLLIRNAAAFGDRPALRHKYLGIWQTWTWAEMLDEVRAYAVGLHRQGVKRGDAIAIVGANRPKLYWSVMAAQTLGAIPVPVYADAVATELAYVLAHAEVRFAAVQDQEQVDKILSVSEQVPKLEKIFYDWPKGLRDYDHANLRPIGELIAEGRKALAADVKVGEWLDGEIAAGKGSDTSIILYTSGTTGQSKGVVLTAERSIAASFDTVTFDKLNRTRRGAGLSAAGLGRRSLPELCARSGVGLLHGLPGIGRHRDGGFARYRADVLLRAAAHLRADADPRHHPDGGRRLHQASSVPHLHWRRAPLRRENPQRRKRAALRPAALRSRQGADLRPAEERAWALSRADRLHGRRGDPDPTCSRSFARSGLNLKQLYGQTEAFLYVTAQPDGQIYADTVGPARPNVDIRIYAENGEVQVKSPGMFVSYFKRTTPRPPTCALTAERLLT